MAMGAPGVSPHELQQLGGKHTQRGESSSREVLPRKRLATPLRTKFAQLEPAMLLHFSLSCAFDSSLRLALLAPLSVLDG